METTDIIAVSIAGMNQLLRAIEIANNGDKDAAEAALREARDHFSNSLEAWDSA